MSSCRKRRSSLTHPPLWVYGMVGGRDNLSQKSLISQICADNPINLLNLSEPIAHFCGFCDFCERLYPDSVLQYAPTPTTQQAHNFRGLCERFCCLSIIGKNTISHSFKKAWFRAKDASDFLRFQWEISLSVRKCWLSLRRARLRIFFKTSYILYKTAAKPNFSFVKSTKNTKHNKKNNEK